MMWRALAASIAAIALSALLIGLVLLGLGASPPTVLAALAEGAFGNWLACFDTLVKATPLLFCGLAVAIAFEASIWNIGAEGQLIAGALIAGALGPALGGWPHTVALFVMLLAGAGGGALWGGIAGWLRARRNVSEIISTIMLNFTAAQLLSWAVHGPLIEPSRAFPESAPIATSAELHLYLAPSRLNFGMLLAVLLASSVYVLLFRTVIGFKLRAVGRNPRAAAWFGISSARLSVAAMTLSGALAGIGGAIHVSAITHRLYETISPGWGYEAIAVALVARLNPLAIIPAAVFFGALDNGAQAMQRSAGIAPELVQVLEGLVIVVLLALDSTVLRGLRPTVPQTIVTREALEAEVPGAADA